MNEDWVDVWGAPSVEAVQQAIAAVPTTDDGAVDVGPTSVEPGMITVRVYHNHPTGQRALSRALYEHLVATTTWDVEVTDGETDAVVAARRTT